MKQQQRYNEPQKESLATTHKTGSHFIAMNQSLESRYAGRAIGAMFFSFFGGAWLCLWIYLAFDGRPAFLAMTVSATAVLAAFAYRRYRRYRLARAAEASSPSRRKAGRIFNIVNAAQWIAIFVVARLLMHFGLSSWFIPSVIFILGLHFLPLAHVFGWRPHYVTGAALMLVAVIYPLLAPAGPASPIGCLGTGLILWSSALWALGTHSINGQV
ncbi:hypothetical protein [Collimonas fungivorans]|uniref:hypothetical protein n=1 Tax=Collimonas fungivorans TaxID=158899 RepID=UPI0026EBEAC3|nr:hypothetical protein [Collimonas fungivorans]